MKSTFAKVMHMVFEDEGGYVNNKYDAGGPTNLGITIGTARLWGVDMDGDGDTDIRDMKLLDKKTASRIYKLGYWDKVRGDHLPVGVDYCCYDFAINSGPSRAIKELQRAIGVGIDGVIGRLTMAALQNYVKQYGEKRLVELISGQRLSFMRGIRGGRDWQHFGRGWTRRVNGVKANSFRFIDEYYAQYGTREQPVVVEPKAPPAQPEVRKSNWALVISALSTVFKFIGGIFSRRS